jgi:hypothetical protein
MVKIVSQHGFPQVGHKFPRLCIDMTAQPFRLISAIR